MPIVWLYNKKNERSHYIIYFTKSFKKSKTLTSALVITFILAFIAYNYIFFAVPVSGSMRPTFAKGDLVLMQTYDVEPHVGDIVMFGVARLGKDEIVTHRVYEVLPGGQKIRTKGDSTPVDAWIIDIKRIHSKAIIIGDKPIVLKGAGAYFLNSPVSSSSQYNFELGLLQNIMTNAKEFGLLIFAICVTLFILLSVNDSIKQKRFRRRN